MSNLLKDKNKLETALNALKDERNKLDNGIVPDENEILKIIGELKEYDDDSDLEIKSLIEKMENLNSLVPVPDTANDTDKIKFVKKIYHISDETEKSKIIEELVDDEIDKFTIFDKALQFFDLDFDGKKIIDSTNDYLVNKNKTILDPLVNSEEFKQGERLKTFTDKLYNDIGSKYQGELDNIFMRPITSAIPAGIDTTSYNIGSGPDDGKITNTAVTKDTTLLYMEVVEKFFKDIKNIKNSASGSTTGSCLRINGRNTKIVQKIIGETKKKLIKTLPDIIKKYLDTQTGGAIDHVSFKSRLMARIYRDIIDRFILLITQHLANLQNKPTTKIKNKINQTATSKNKNVENVASFIQKYLALVMESRMKTLTQYDYMLIHYLEDLNLPVHISLSIFMISKRSIIEDLIGTHAPDKIFAIHEIIRLKKSSDYLRFEHNYGPINSIMGFY